MNIKRQLNRLPQGLKASTALFAATVITKGIAYLTTPLYTRLLTAEEYGRTSVFLTWLNLFGIVTMFCLSYGVFNNGMVDFPSRRNEYSFSMLGLSNIITLCTYGLLLAFYPCIRKWIGLDWPLMLLMGAIFLFQPAYNFWTQHQRYELKYKATVFWTVLSAVVPPVCALICIRFSGTNRLYARIFGEELPLIAIYIGFYFYVASKGRWRVAVKYWKSAVLFNLPLIPHYLSGYVLGSSDKLMISHFVGDAYTARYGVAYAVASIGSIVWTSVNASLIPFTYEKCKENDFEPISRVTVFILTAIFALCFIVIMLAPEVVMFMATSDYREAIYVIPPVVGGVFFQVQYFIYANIIYYYKRPVYVMCGSVFSSVLNIILNYIFIRRFGYIAAGYTTLFSYFVQAAIDYVAMKKVVGSSVYDMRFLGVLSLIVVMLSVLSGLIYDYIVIRYGIIVTLFIVIYLSREKLIELFRQNVKGQ